MKQIKLSLGQFAIVDDEDFEYLSQWVWHAQPSRGTYYAVRSGKPINGKRQQIRMHRVILHLKDSQLIADHKDRNGLNNQKSNLRVVNVHQNNMNKKGHSGSKSKYKGVSWYERNKKWGARIRVKGSPQVFLGLFKTEEEAAKKYDQVVSKYHGEFAYLNFTTYE